MATSQTENRVRQETEPNGRSGRSLTDLIKELRVETTELLQEEIELAKTEISEKLSTASRNATYLAIGGAVTYAGLLILLFSAAAGLYVAMVALGLSNEASGWLAPLIVAGIVLAIGYGLLQKGLNRMRDESLVPERTTRTVQDDKQWIQEKVKS